MSITIDAPTGGVKLTCPAWCASHHRGSGRLVDLDHCSATSAITDDSGQFLGDVYIVQRGELSNGLTVVYGDVEIGGEFPDCQTFTAQQARAIAALLVAAAETAERAESR